ncbi:MAG: S-layer homology domain-containing protein, partial [Clostridia bacterium]|nr:S-layer homology domain-containing protein [Clostridia bacterium]
MKKTVSLLLTIILSCLATPNTLAAPVFSDNVAPFLAELEIMQGDPDGNLRLDSAVSRAECAKIVVAASSFRDMVAAGSKTSPFQDVAADHWAAPYITVAVRNGLCKGYLDATFRPANPVSFEEALTMFLRVLGYSEEDFGSSWPDGQIGIAQNIGLCDGLHRVAGEALTRRDIMTIVYNMLNTPAKNAGSDYLSNFNRTIIDDVILIASENESASVDVGKIATSAGTYKITESFYFS